MWCGGRNSLWGVLTPSHRPLRCGPLFHIQSRHGRQIRIDRHHDAVPERKGDRGDLDVDLLHRATDPLQFRENPAKLRCRPLPTLLHRPHPNASPLGTRPPGSRRSTPVRDRRRARRERSTESAAQPPQAPARSRGNSYSGAESGNEQSPHLLRALLSSAVKRRGGDSLSRVLQGIANTQVMETTPVLP